MKSRSIRCSEKQLKLWWEFYCQICGEFSVGKLSAELIEVIASSLFMGTSESLFHCLLGKQTQSVKMCQEHCWICTLLCVSLWEPDKVNSSCYLCVWLLGTSRAACTRWTGLVRKVSSVMSLPLPFRIFPAFYCQQPGTLGTENRKPGSFTGEKACSGDFFSSEWLIICWLKSLHGNRNQREPLKNSGGSCLVWRISPPPGFDLE